MSLQQHRHVEISAEGPIGLFDSGVGGLTVLSALMQQLPEERYMYFGDTARLPYGAKSTEFIRDYTLRAANFLVDRGIKALVIACNTATAAALPALQQTFPELPVVGVIAPGAQAAVAAAGHGSVVIMATESTVRSKAYHHAIAEQAPNATIFAVPCPLLVTLAEEGWIESSEGAGALSVADAVVRRYLDSVTDYSGQASSALQQPPDCIVLGCTHFPFFAPSVRLAVGSHTVIVNPAVSTASLVKELLRERSLFSTTARLDGQAQMQFFVTAAPERFIPSGSKLLGRKISETAIQQVEL